MEQVGGMGTLEPLSILFLIIVQLGGRYLKIDLTPAQQKLINNSIFQSIILFSIILMSTKSLTNSIIIIFVIICIKVKYFCNIVAIMQTIYYNVFVNLFCYIEKIVY